jgi:hypothetical protein
LARAIRTSLLCAVHRHYFAQAFRQRIKEVQLAKQNDPENDPTDNWRRRLTRTLSRNPTVREAPAQDLYALQEKQSPATPLKKRRKGGMHKHVKPDMIRRTTDKPMLINPSGWITEGESAEMKPMPPADTAFPSTSTSAEMETQQNQIAFLGAVRIDDADPKPSSASTSSSSTEENEASSQTMNVTYAYPYIIPTLP